MDIHGSPGVFSLNRIVTFVLDSKAKVAERNGSTDRDSPWRGKYLNNQWDMLPDNGVQPPCISKGIRRYNGGTGVSRIRRWFTVGLNSTTPRGLRGSQWGEVGGPEVVRVSRDS